ncbi:MAG TPA: membrane protein insertion efficiency factor YidD [Candidatus Omnitrophota bacterium]|nr:membrane protein insertion efficiency factor YidD [Candidatus Omnitrophota bacterium]
MYLTLQKLFIHSIALYQRYVSSLLPHHCRFRPSCSEYAVEAVVRHGFVRGGYKALARILRCHPFSGKSGYDPLI